MIVHGACPTGVDKAFDDAAKFCQVDREPYPADWDAHGKAAGPIRNSEMVATSPELCMAFHANLDRKGGTYDCASKAVKFGIPVWHFRNDESEPMRVVSLRIGMIEYEV